VSLVSETARPAAVQLSAVYCTISIYVYPLKLFTVRYVGAEAGAEPEAGAYVDVDVHIAYDIFI
jgi:hypothetical protein